MVNNVRFISEEYIKTYSPITDNNQMKDLFPHIDAAQQINIQQILGSKFMEDLQTKFDNRTLSSDEEVLVGAYLKPAVLYRTLVYALPFIQYNLRNKGIMVNSDDAANSSDISGMKFILHQLVARAEDLENKLIKYLCDNSKLFPLYTSQNGLVMPTTKSRVSSGLIFY